MASSPRGKHPVTLTIKAPYQEIEDQIIQADLGWTVDRLKEHLSKVYPGHPPKHQQRLIYFGQQLNNDSQRLNDILKQLDNVEHVIFLVSPSKAKVNNTLPSTSQSTAAQSSGQSSSNLATYLQEVRDYVEYQFLQDMRLGDIPQNEEDIPPNNTTPTFETPIDSLQTAQNIPPNNRAPTFQTPLLNNGYPYAYYTSGIFNNQQYQYSQYREHLGRYWQNFRNTQNLPSALNGPPDRREIIEINGVQIPSEVLQVLQFAARHFPLNSTNPYLQNVPDINRIHNNFREINLSNYTRGRTRYFAIRNVRRDPNNPNLVEYTLEPINLRHTRPNYNTLNLFERRDTVVAVIITIYVASCYIFGPFTTTKFILYFYIFHGIARILRYGHNRLLQMLGRRRPRENNWRADEHDDVYMDNEQDRPEVVPNQENRRNNNNNNNNARITLWRIICTFFTSFFTSLIPDVPRDAYR